MPYQDGTGPRGSGPLTGRGFGPCSGNRPIIDPPFRRLGRGLGRGLGQGFRQRLINKRGFRQENENIVSFSNSNLWTSELPE